MLPDRVFYPLAALVAVALIALAIVYPQGEGARSPKPFGHATYAQTHPKPVKTTTDAEKAKLKGAF